MEDISRIYTWKRIQKSSAFSSIMPQHDSSKLPVADIRIRLLSFAFEPRASGALAATMAHRISLWDFEIVSLY